LADALKVKRAVLSCKPKGWGRTCGADGRVAACGKHPFSVRETVAQVRDRYLWTALRVGTRNRKAAAGAKVIRIEK
jgi:hypothetical protein